MPYIGNTPAEKYAAFDVQYFTTSATTSYTLDHAVANELDIRLVINNVIQEPGSGKAYTASGTTLTLSGATAGTDTMYCVYTDKASQTVNPPAGSVGPSQIANNAVDLTSKVTGTLPTANGGTGSTSATFVNNTNTNSTLITSQTAKTSLVDADKFLISDSAASGALKYVEKQYLPSGSLVPITTVAFSSGTELVINNCFSATYLNYMMIISLLVPQSDASLNYRFNVGGTVDSTTNYRYTLSGTQNDSSGTTSQSNGTTDEGRLFYDIDADTEAGASGVFYIHNPFGGFQRKQIHGNTMLQKGTASNTTQYQVASDYHNSSVKNFTGINLFSSGATNWRAGSTSGGYGRVSIFGIVNS